MRTLYDLVVGCGVSLEPIRSPFGLSRNCNSVSNDTSWRVLPLDFWRLRSSEEGRAKQEERDQPDLQIPVAISSRAKKPCSVMWQAEQHRAGSRVADSSI